MYIKLYCFNIFLVLKHKLSTFEAENRVFHMHAEGQLRTVKKITSVAPAWPKSKRLLRRTPPCTLCVCGIKIVMLSINLNTKPSCILRYSIPLN